MGEVEEETEEIRFAEPAKPGLKGERKGSADLGVASCSADNESISSSVVCLGEKEKVIPEPIYISSDSEEMEVEEGFPQGKISF